MSDEGRSGLPPSPRRRGGDPGPPPPPQPPAGDDDATDRHEAAGEKPVATPPSAPSRDDGHAGEGAAPETTPGVVRHQRGADPVVVRRQAAAPVDVRPHEHRAAGTDGGAQDIIPTDDPAGGTRAAVAGGGAGTDGAARGRPIDTPPDRRPRPGQEMCPACREGVPRGAYFCRNGHRQRSEDRSTPEEPAAAPRPRSFGARLGDVYGPHLDASVRGFRIGATAVAVVAALALLVPPVGGRTRAAVADGVRAVLGREAPAVADVEATAEPAAAPGMPASQAVDGHDLTAWGVRWQPQLEGPPDEAAGCAATAPDGVPELRLSFEPTAVRAVEVRSGVDPSVTGAGEHHLPAEVAVRVDDDHCRVLSFDAEPGERSAGFRLDREVGEVVVRILDAHDADTPGLTSLRDVVIRKGG